MSVERRYGHRIPVNFDINLLYRGRRLPSAKVRNLSAEGVFVKTSGITLPTGTLVELGFNRWNQEWLIPAIVIHGDKRGVGLMFRESQDALFELDSAASRQNFVPAGDTNNQRGSLLQPCAKHSQSEYLPWYST